jgi:hypothetical protein
MDILRSPPLCNWSDCPLEQFYFKVNFETYRVLMTEGMNFWVPLERCFKNVNFPKSLNHYLHNELTS